MTHIPQQVDGTCCTTTDQEEEEEEEVKKAQLFSSDSKNAQSNKHLVSGFQFQADQHTLGRYECCFPFSLCYFGLMCFAISPHHTPMVDGLERCGSPSTGSAGLRSEDRAPVMSTPT